MGGIYWLASYLKSGNTWFRAFLSNLRGGGTAPADINALDREAIAAARGWLDEVLGFDTADLPPGDVELLRPHVYRWSRHSPGIAYHKIHDAYTWTAAGEPLVSREGTLGAIYLIRNPLDVAVSLAHHWQCSIDQTIDRMGSPDTMLALGRTGMAAQVRQRLLTWSGHVGSWVEAPGLRCEVVRYEDMLTDPLPTFTRAAAFLGLPTDPEHVARAIRFSEFRELARQEAQHGFEERRPGMDRFFRHGRRDGWQGILTRNQVARLLADHGRTMRRFGYATLGSDPVEPDES